MEVSDSSSRCLRDALGMGAGPAASRPAWPRLLWVPEGLWMHLRQHWSPQHRPEPCLPGWVSVASSEQHCPWKWWERRPPPLYPSCALASHVT